MAQTSADVANEALALIGYDGFPISAPAPAFDSSVPGQVAQKIYPAAVAAVARLNAWGFARTIAGLTVTGNVAPFPWAYEYFYPANCIDIWQLMPATLADPNNPTPVSWARGVAVVAIALVGPVQSSVIWANIPAAQAVFNGNPLEQTWDPLFRASVVSYLAAEFAMANLGKPDMASFYMDKWKEIIPAAMARTDQ